MWAGGKTGDDIKDLPISIVYGIAITAMNFFTDPTIAALTSGTPSQNVDLEGISFPRRMGVRFHPEFIRHYNLQGVQARWMAYRDRDFTTPLDDPETPVKDKVFYHEDLVTREGWARYYFKGIFETDIAYIKLELINPKTGLLIKTFYFEFRKSYQTSLDGRHYQKDPVLDEKIVRDGFLTELVKKTRKTKSGKMITRYEPGTVKFKSVKLTNLEKDVPDKIVRKLSAITTRTARYSEHPKAIFLVTPPHLMKYAKLLLILLKQLVDLNFERSYMTKPNQKPLVRTNFMLDELGNLQSEGHGISGFETMLSIGLGQDQRFTLILQTLQQLRDVYGDSIDKVIQGNIANIVFLKSTDDSMIDTLQKMSGTTHKVYRNSKTVQRDVSAVAMQNRGEVSYTLSVVEEPVIKYNDLAFLPDRNSVIFSTDSPVWNRNDTILPMSWALFENTITQPGKDYTLQSIPTLSTSMEFDRDANQPNFEKMFEKRMAQALKAEEADLKYRKAYDRSDYDIARLDKDVYADEVMELIEDLIRQDEENGEADTELLADVQDNLELKDELKKAGVVQQAQDRKRYAGGLLSRTDIRDSNHSLDSIVIKAFLETKAYFKNDRENFSFDHGSLYGRDANLYIEKLDDKLIEDMKKAAKNKGASVYAEDDDSVDAAALGWKVHDEFYDFLLRQDEWDFAGGRFDREMDRLLRQT